MNIFVLDMSPEISAKHMVDKHVVKMPTESMQMLSTNLDYFGIQSPYKPVMLNHPCTIWARQSYENHEWLLEHCLALCKEYTARYGKTHAVENTFNQYWDELHQQTLYAHWPTIGLTPFAIAMDDAYRVEQNKEEDDFSFAIRSYHNYYCYGKNHIANWKIPEHKPDWFEKKYFKRKKTTNVKRISWPPRRD